MRNVDIEEGVFAFGFDKVSQPPITAISGSHGTSYMKENSPWKGNRGHHWKHRDTPQNREAGQGQARFPVLYWSGQQVGCVTLDRFREMSVSPTLLSSLWP